MLPKLGNVTSQWTQQNGQPVLVLQNALGLSPTAIALPQALAMLPALCDGTRDLNALRASLMVRAGVRISVDVLAQIIQQMDEALLFENARQAEAIARALDAYHQAESRQPVSAGQSYPPDPQEARRLLDEFVQQAAQENSPALPRPAEQIRGLLSPHIDYYRGGKTYAQVWSAAKPALEQADLVVILGTDHRGAAGAITLTRQHYRTPWGILKTDQEAVHQVAQAIGVEEAFAHELHHAVEHSVELAAIWLHYMAPQAHFTLLPILCGSFAEFLNGSARIEDHAGVRLAAEALRTLSQGHRRVLLVAAADLAHMGPAFGGYPVGLVERGRCRAADESLLDAICRGDAQGFLSQVQAEGDRRNICGIPPVYLMLNVLGPASGIVTGYEQCPADGQGTSLVSIAGALLW